MGIRIHKVLGYGVDNLKHGKKGWDIEDPRIDAKKFQELHDEAYETGVPEIIKWLKKEKNDLVGFYKKHHPSKVVEDKKYYDLDYTMFLRGIEDHADKKEISDFGGSVIHDGEYGLPNVLMFVPPTCPDWRRYDDAIDYHEETGRGGQANWCKVLKSSGIFPWSGRWIRFRDPKPGVLKDDAKKDDLINLDPMSYGQLVGWWDEKAQPLAKGDALKHFLEDYRPVIPMDVMAVLWFMKDVFKDIDSFVNELGPMIYVYWG